MWRVKGIGWIQKEEGEDEGRFKEGLMLKIEYITLKNIIGEIWYKLVVHSNYTVFYLANASNVFCMGILKWTIKNK
jgi:hypothetical protein